MDSNERTNGSETTRDGLPLLQEQIRLAGYDRWLCGVSLTKRRMSGGAGKRDRFCRDPSPYDPEAIAGGARSSGKVYIPKELGI